MTKNLNENTLAEQPVLDWLKGLGYDVEFGPDLAPGGAFQERDDFRTVLLKPRLLRVLKRLNPNMPDAALEEGVRELEHIASEHPQLIFNNKKIYEHLSRGVVVSYRDGGKEETKELVVIDFANPLNNEFLAVNQFAIQGMEKVRRPDVVVFVNGIPLGVFELKSPTSARAEATTEAAIDQLDGYKRDIPLLFAYNQVLVAGDLLTAKHGTISSSREWYAEWKYVNDEVLEWRPK